MQKAKSLGGGGTSVSKKKSRSGDQMSAPHSPRPQEDNTFMQKSDPMATSMGQTNFAQNNFGRRNSGDGAKGHGDGGKDAATDSVAPKFNMPPEAIEQVKATWSKLLSMTTHIELGSLMYDALFEKLPKIRTMFVSPRLATAMRFAMSLHSLIMTLEHTEKTEEFTYNLSLRHVKYWNGDAAIAQANMSAFLGAILVVLENALDERWTTAAAEAWGMMFGYLAEAMVANVTSFGKKIMLIKKSWKKIIDETTQLINAQSGGEDEVAAKAVVSNKAEQISNKKFANLGMAKLGVNLNKRKKQAKDTATAGGTQGTKNTASMKTRTSFGEAFRFNLGMMAPEFMAMFKTMTLEQFSVQFTVMVGQIVDYIDDPPKLLEDLYILSVRHLHYNTKPDQFPIFGQAVMATLRGLLPSDWNWEHETAWAWCWGHATKILVDGIATGHGHRKEIETSHPSLLKIGLDNVGTTFYTNLFQDSPQIQMHFIKPNRMLSYIVQKTIEMIGDLHPKPREVMKGLKALAMRHIKYDAPPEFFGDFENAMLKTLEESLKSAFTEAVKEAWKAALQFIASTIVRAIRQGSNLVTAALLNNSAEEMERALDSAPRRERAQWLLNVSVDGEKLSPLNWAITDGKLTMGKTMIDDLLAIRADRENYYCGKDKLFKTHPEIIKLLADNSPALLPSVLDGLMWQSRHMEERGRRVNYYIAQLYGNPYEERNEDVYTQSLAELVRLGDPVLFTHPTAHFLLELKWQMFAKTIFLRQELTHLLNLVIFMEGYIWVSDTNHAILLRLVVAGINTMVLCGTYLPRICREIWTNQTYKVPVLQIGLRRVEIGIPRFLSKFSNVAKILLSILLGVMSFVDPLLRKQRVWDVHDYMVEDHGGQKFRTLLATGSIVMWLLVTDLFGASIELSAFRHCVGQMFGELGKFGILAVIYLMAFGTAVHVAMPQLQEFQDVFYAVLTLFSVMLGIFELDFGGQHNDLVLQLALLIFMILAVVLLLNLLIAQLNQTYHEVWKEMTGYALMHRASITVEIESTLKMEKRKAMWDSLNFEEPLEFDKADIGIAGGVQTKQMPQRIGAGTKSDEIHDRSVDRIQRFAGDPNPLLPWPVKDNKTKSLDARMMDVETQLIKLRKTLASRGAAGGAGKLGTVQEDGRVESSKKTSDSGGGSDHEDD